MAVLKKNIWKSIFYSCGGTNACIVLHWPLGHSTYVCIQTAVLSKISLEKHFFMHFLTGTRPTVFIEMIKKQYLLF